MTTTVTIPIDEYEELIHDQEILYALEAWGVDNWSGYYDALEEAGLLDSDDDEDDEEE